jgi:hypothetical protein
VWNDARVPTRVPAGSPPILLSLDYAIEQPPLPESFGDAVRYEAGQLRLVSTVPDGNRGIAADQTLFRDIIVQAQVSLADGADDDMYGLFIRSPEPELYYSFAVSPTGQVVVSYYDGEYQPLVAGPLAPEMPFAHGMRTPNTFQVVAVGPSLTFYLNGMLVTAEIVDERFQEGFVGFYVHHGSQGPRAELGADWIQLRGIFPES